MDESLNQDSKSVIGFFEFAPRQTIENALRWVWSRRAKAVCAALLLGMSVQMLAALSRKSVTTDEIVHIPAGYYHLVAGHYQLNNEHPPLAKMWSAIPLLFIQPSESTKTAEEIEAHFINVTWSFQGRFWSANRNQFELISFWARFMMIIVTVGLGVLIFMFARELFGEGVALLAVAMFSLEPTVLAHGRVVHTDLPAEFVYLLFFFALLRYFKTRTLRSALWLGLISGLALITKFSMIVLLPILTCLVVCGIVFASRLAVNRKKVLLHAGLVLCLLLLVINIAYRFERPKLEPGDVKWVQAKSPENFDNWMTFFRVGSTVLPTYYLFGQYNVMLHNRDGHATSLLGQYSTKGWWYYFPVAFALKTTVPFLLAAIAGIVWALYQLLMRKDNRFVWLLLPLAIYLALSMSSHINIGVRHLLPAYSFLFIAAAVVLERLLQVKRKQAKYGGVACAVVLFTWMSVEMVRSYPNYIPYLNQLAFSHPRWWYLSDSNVEWGEDAKALAAYLHARGETEVRGAVAAGWGTLVHYGIRYHDIFPRPGVTIPETRYVAIGASFLNGSTVSLHPDPDGKVLSDEQRVNFLDAYRHIQPEAILGNSIYLYRVR
jgi:hypothetical protein